MDNDLSWSARFSLGITTQLPLWLMLLVLQVMALSFSVDAIGLQGEGVLSILMSKAGILSKFIIAFLVVLIILIAPQFRSYLNQLSDAQQGKFRWYWLFAQTAVFLCFYIFTLILFGQRELPQHSQLLSILWLTFGLATGIFSLLILAPLSFWLQFCRNEKLNLMAAAAFGAIAYLSGNLTQQFWQPMAELTFQVSQWFLTLMYDEVVVDQTKMILGTGDFAVTIAPACSGYEGAGLISILTAVYLWVFKKEFRFPNALLLFPIGIVSVWGFNALRISLLIALGSSYSPTVALEGFHSQAGWIFFICVAVFLLFIAHRLRFFSFVPTKKHVVSNEADSALYLLAPLITLLTAILITTAFISEFDWLYPIRVISTAAVLLFFWKKYNFQITSIHFMPFLIGILVTILWLVMVEQSDTDDQLFASTLFGTSGAISTAWIIIRIMGATITVSLAEELVFRGYLLSRLSAHTLLSQSKITFSLIPFLLSSLLFGLLHGEWIAGTVAGMCYAFARYHRGSLGDAVVAHMTTNGLLSLYIVLTGSWSLW